MKSQKLGQGLRQRQLCERLGLNYKAVALSAKQLGLSTHEYIQQETGWILKDELYYPSNTQSTKSFAKSKPQHSKLSKVTKLLELLLIGLLFASAIWFVNTVGIDQVRANVSQFGLWAPLIVLLLRLTSIVIPALPGSAYSVLAGAVFGFMQGLIIIAIADLIACIFNFYIAKHYGRDLVQKLVGQRFMERVDTLGKKYLERNIFLVTGFLMTGLFDFVCYAVGLTQMRWRKFLAALLFSIAIAKPPLVALGAGLLEGGKAIVSLALLGIFGLALLTGWLNQRENAPRSG
jgi:uncharacterized membrane protein YdjX (TVP38/TMEM64 family)